MKSVGIVLAIACTSTAGVCNAAVVGKVSVDVHITKVSGPAQNGSLDKHFSFDVMFPIVFNQVVDSGPRTYTNFLIGANNAIRSDVFSLLPPAAQSATAYQIVAGQTDDYPDAYYKSISFSDQRYYDAGAYLGQTVSGLSFTAYEPSRGGTGSGDEVLTLNDIRDILRAGKQSSFFLFDRIYNPADSRTTFEGTATILSFSAAPEPDTWAMMIAGFAMVGRFARRRRTSGALA